MLFPVINKVRYATYSASTQQEISQLQNAINQYYATFHAYPGPFSNDQIEGNTTGIPFDEYTVVSGTVTYTTIGSGTVNTGFNSTMNITASENLVLGLLGGLRAHGPTLINDFAPGEVGLGPLNLNNAINTSAYIPQRYPPFLNVSSGGNTSLLMWCGTYSGGGNWRANTAQPGTLTGFTDLAGNMANDTMIPEFVDRFPVPGPLPILYLRARTGAPGIISDGKYVTVPDPNSPLSGLPIPYQYDIRDISSYTGLIDNNTPSNPHLGLPGGTTPPTHNLIPPPSSSGYTFNYGQANAPHVDGVKVTSQVDTGVFFQDESMTPTNTGGGNMQWVNYTGRPRAVDSFILISAGPDGIYGTADDITSFGNASQ
jgi:hypothetical protein